jgi:SAM-dependent MidA family methyltransferase
MNDPAKTIAEEIRRKGPMPLARFMQLALYMPGCGYYERPRPIGRGGDFQTSVSVGGLFGDLLAFQFSRWLELLDFPKYTIMELGAHDGRLATDILGWFERFRPALLARLQYCFIESSPTRRAWQQRALDEWAAGSKTRGTTGKKTNVRWLAGIPTAERSVRGVIFSNEFFDALPMHRLGWNAPLKKWREWRVALDDSESLAWQLGRLSPQAAWHQPILPAKLAAVLPDGYTVEICPKAADIWRACAQCLGAGKLLAIDYGLTAEEWLRPERTSGTLRAYAAHRAACDVLENPGGQDITAHINFSGLQIAGEKAGLRTDSLSRQETFLTRILAASQAHPESFPPWTPHRVRQFQTLTHPQHFGASFRVLLQGVKAE